MGFIEDVMQAAVKIQIKYGLPAATITAQACLETGFGKYVCKDRNTGQYSYNLFNIKGTGPAGSVLVKTWEVYNGKKTNILAKFRAYRNYEESFADYAKLITGSKRYAPAVSVKSNPDQYAYTIQRCGYATDPDYPRKLISIMNQYHLRELANECLKRMVNAVFADVLNHWAKNDIEWLAKEGLVKGDENGNFRPDAPPTRAEMAVMVKRGIDYVLKKIKEGA